MPSVPSTSFAPSATAGTGPDGEGLGAQDRLVKRPEAAEQLGVSADMVRKMQRQGQRTLVKVGRAARVQQSEIDAFIAGHLLGGVQYGG